jgi:6-phosphofructokinase
MAAEAVELSSKHNTPVVSCIEKGNLIVNALQKKIRTSLEIQSFKQKMSKTRREQKVLTQHMIDM